MVLLNLKDEQNKQLIKLVSDEEVESVEEEMEFKIFKLVKSLNQRKITNPISSARQTSRLETQSTQCKTVNINFHYDKCTTKTHNFDVKTSISVAELFEQIQLRRTVRKKQELLKLYLNF